MNPTPRADSPSEPDQPANSPDVELQRLRSLLLAPDRRRLDRLESASHGLTAEDVGSVLPEAVQLRTKSDRALSNALSPAVEGAMRESIRRDPQSLADAIFPIIGPAIRRSIQMTLREFVENLNRTAEQSLSLRGLGWRVESLRTGRPFAEVLLRHNLIFRVEQLFLIHRDSGVLLDDATSAQVSARDPELVSAMLSALQSFVSDSFEGRELGRLEFGEQVLLVSQGAHAVIAAVAQGTAPSDFATRMSETLEHYHRQFGVRLSEFSGDTAPFELEHDHLEQLLVEKTRERSSPSRARVILPLMAGLVGIALVAWLLRDIRFKRDYDSVIDRLVREPGIQVSSAERDGAAMELRGLYDPDARPLEAVLQDLELEGERVDALWEPFVSQAPSVVLARAQRQLTPPQNVALGLESGVLKATGSAPHAWIQATRDRAPHLPGVDVYDDTGLSDPQLEQLDRALDTLRLTRPQFEAGSSAIPPKVELQTLLERVEAAQEAALAAQFQVTLTLRGTAAPGETSDLASLANERAHTVAEVIGRKAQASVLTVVVAGFRAEAVPAKGAVAHEVTIEATRRPTTDSGKQAP